VVDNNADGLGLLLANTCLLQLCEGESAALTELAVVANSLGTDGGAKKREGADTKGGSLGLAGIAATELATGLVEPGFDSALPVLAEVVLVKDCGL